MEQELYKAIWWWFVGLGLGLSIRVLYMALKSGVTDYKLIDDYLKKNLLVIIFVALCYTAIVVMWRSTDIMPAVDALGVYPRVVNAWSIVICFLGDMIFAYVIAKAKAKFGNQDPLT